MTLFDSGGAQPLTVASVRREHGRAILTLSTGETLMMPRAMLKERPYRGGVPFDRVAFHALLKNRAYPYAMERAVSLLAVRARTKKELEDALRRCAYPEDAVSRVLAYLEQVGYLDDAGFASQWAASRQAKGLGARRIARELRRKGVDASAVEQTLEGMDDGAQLDAALFAARKAARGRNLDDPRDRQKLLAALARRGFDYALARRTLERLREEQNEP